jgi:hypothetical protein
MIDIDRSFLSDTLAQLTTILDAFPVRGDPPPTEPRHAQPPKREAPQFPAGASGRPSRP